MSADPCLDPDTTFTDAPFSREHAGHGCRAPLRRLSSLRRMLRDSRMATEEDMPCSTMTPRLISSRRPPQANGAKCGVACHYIAAAKDYIFTAYAKR